MLSKLTVESINNNTTDTNILLKALLSFYAIVNPKAKAKT